jgi:transposase
MSPTPPKPPATGRLAGTKLETALAALETWTLAIVKRSDVASGFELLPRRWVVERTLAWLNRNRRLAKDFEALLATAAAWLMLGSVKLLMRRLARG